MTTSCTAHATKAFHIVLAGGGHTHALLVRRWGQSPPPGIQLTLISPERFTPYSGMLPGLIAGHYAFADLHIDLEKLCRWAGVAFRRDAVVGLTPDENCVTLSSDVQVAYDLVSLNTGSEPDQSVPGVAEHAIPVKPISTFWPRWQTVLESLGNTPREKSLAVVGGGAGAVEVCLAMAYACQRQSGNTGTPRFALLTAEDGLLPAYPDKVQRIARQACLDVGIDLYEGARVTAVGPDHLQIVDGRHLAANHVFWCTQAAAPLWPEAAGLACDDSGFVRVNATLQSLSHPRVFAVGDLAHMTASPRPKAGVFAVRQAPVLTHNLASMAAGGTLRPFLPQQSFLSLLALGPKIAVGSRRRVVFSGRWVWQWKNHIDQAFMRQFKQLP